MLKSKLLWRTLALAFLGMLVLVQQTSTMGATAGREYSRCIIACNDVMKVCKANCVDDCKALFPGDTPAITACVDSCKNICNFESAECKEVCEAIKEPPSPEEP